MGALAAVALSATILLAAMVGEEPKTEDLFNWHIYDGYLSMRVATEADIVKDYEWQQVQCVPLLLPDTQQVLTRNGGVLPVGDWSGFAKEFVENLAPVERDGITYWPVMVMEDASASPRRRVIVNAKDKIIGELPVPKDYDAAWWVKGCYPQLYDEKATASDEKERQRLEALFDGSRLVVEYDLVDHANLVKLVLKQSVDAALRAEAEEEGGGMMLMSWQGGSVTNLKFVEFAPVGTNGTKSVMVAYPDDFTNRISLIACTNLVAPDWALLITTNPPPTTNTFTYVDVAAANYAFRFYHAYNADYDGDGDGVADGEEKYLDDTDPDDPDDPPNVKGIVNYAGGQAGPIYVVAVTTAGSWSTNKCARRSQPGGYVIPKLAAGTYYIKTWRDSNANGTANTNTEAFAIYPTTVTVNGQVTNVNLTLADPDLDGDGMADWWETHYLGGTNALPTDDADDDGFLNVYEYVYRSNPTNPAAAPALSSSHYYVATNGNHTSPFHSWATAATNIQAALDAVTNDYAVVWVADGTYTGVGNEQITFPDTPLILTSVNGPSASIIQGDGQTESTGVVLSNDVDRHSVLLGLTIRGFDDAGIGVSGAPTIQGCWVISNSPVGIRCTGAPTMRHCYVAANEGDGPGAAGIHIQVQGEESAVVVAGCTIVSNNVFSGWGGGIYADSYRPIVIEDCVVEHNSSETWHGGGIAVIRGDGTVIRRCQISGNTAAGEGGGIWYKDGASAVVEFTVIQSNTAQYGGGMFGKLDEWSVENCSFLGNASTYDAGGLYVRMAYMPGYLRNCLFAGNTTGGKGGAAIVRTADGMIENCTFVSNVADAGGGLYLETFGLPSPNMANCIVWGNAPDQIEATGTSTSVIYSCVQGGFSGANNITNNPLLSADYHLTSFSPCVDAGTNAPWMWNSTDIDGEDRVSGSIVDMGCDEHVDEN